MIPGTCTIKLHTDTGNKKDARSLYILLQNAESLIRTFDLSVMIHLSQVSHIDPLAFFILAVQV